MPEKFTPTPEMPFRLPLHYGAAPNGGTDIFDAGGSNLGTMREGLFYRGLDRMTAAYIVRAVNAHADLYAACKAAMDETVCQCRQQENRGISDTLAGKCFHCQVVAALAKAEGRQP